MSEEKEQALVPVEQKEIEFYDDEITAVLVEMADGQQLVFVPIRPICNFLGLSWPGQRERINRDPVLSEVIRGVRVTRTPGTGGGAQEMLCLPLDYLNGWLFKINASRVKAEIRENLIRYQRDCYRILANAFSTSSTIVQPIDASETVLMQLHNMALAIAATTKEMLEARRMAVDNKTRLDAAREYIRGMNERLKTVEQRTLAGPLTEEQAREIKKRVNLIAQELTVLDPGKKHYPGIYAALEEETGATSYKRIPPKGYEAALAFLDGWLESIQRASKKQD